MANNIGHSIVVLVCILLYIVKIITGLALYCHSWICWEELVKSMYYSTTDFYFNILSFTFFLGFCCLFQPDVTAL